MKDLQLTSRLWCNALACASLTAALAFTACKDEDTPTLYEAYATVVQENATAVETDYNGILYPSNYDKVKEYKADSVGQRLYIRYANDKDSETKNSITIYEFAAIKTAPVIEAEDDHIDNYGKDPIVVQAANFANKNIDLYFTVRFMNPTKDHKIRLVSMPKQQLDPTGYVTLRLCHEANGDEKYYETSGWKSFSTEVIPGMDDQSLNGVIIEAYNNDGQMESIKLPWGKKLKQ